MSANNWYCTALTYNSASTVGQYRQQTFRLIETSLFRVGPAQQPADVTKCAKWRLADMVVFSPPAPGIRHTKGKINSKQVTIPFQSESERSKISLSSNFAHDYVIVNMIPVCVRTYVCLVFVILR